MPLKLSRGTHSNACQHRNIETTLHGAMANMRRHGRHWCFEPRLLKNAFTGGTIFLLFFFSPFFFLFFFFPLKWLRITSVYEIFSTMKRTIVANEISRLCEIEVSAVFSLKYKFECDKWYVFFFFSIYKRVLCIFFLSKTKICSKILGFELMNLVNNWMWD